MNNSHSNELSVKSQALTGIEAAKLYAKLVMGEFVKPNIDNQLFMSILSKEEFISDLITIYKKDYDYILNVLDDKYLPTRLIEILVKNELPTKYNYILPEAGSTLAKLIAILNAQYIIVESIKYLETLKDEVDNIPKMSANEKIKWNARLCDFGILINQLVENGFIEPPIPKKGDKKNYKSQLASLCYSAFYVPNQDGTGEVTPNNFYQEIKKPWLTDPDTFFFKIIRKNKKL